MAALAEPIAAGAPRESGCLCVFLCMSLSLSLTHSLCVSVPVSVSRLCVCMSVFRVSVWHASRDAPYSSSHIWALSEFGLECACRCV